MPSVKIYVSFKKNENTLEFEANEEHHAERRLK
jgi:hypothetical protein